MRKIAAMMAIWMLAAAVLVGCSGGSEKEPETTPVQTEEKTAAEIPSQDDLNSIPQRKAKSYQNVFLEISDSECAMQLKIPDDWTLVERENVIKAARDGIDVAEFRRADGAYVHSDGCLSHSQTELVGITAEACVLPSENGDWCGYRHHVEIVRTVDGQSERIILDADYAELSDFSVRALMANAGTTLLQSDAGIGSLKKFGETGRNSILILGNSFIGTSSVGELLQQMIDAAGRTETVRAISRGYATVQSYVESGDCLDMIASKQYGAVFMCGFYGQEAVNSLESIVKVCRTSGTMLVIFPAHNESESVVKSAYAKWKNDAYFLNWKGEVDGLIRYTNAQRSDMCVNDQHNHSTAAAGYVGAHMIYRALFGEMPPTLWRYPFTTEEAIELFGSSYVKTGTYEMVQPTEVYRFR